MKQNRDLHFDSRVIHDALSPEQWEGSTLPPKYQIHPCFVDMKDTVELERAMTIIFRILSLLWKKEVSWH